MYFLYGHYTFDNVICTAGKIAFLISGHYIKVLNNVNYEKCKTYQMRLLERLQIIQNKERNYRAITV